jgi:hypothetical protein
MFGDGETGEAVFSSEMLVLTYQSTGSYNPKDHNTILHRREDSNILYAMCDGLFLKQNLPAEIYDIFDNELFNKINLEKNDSVKLSPKRKAPAKYILLKK